MNLSIALSLPRALTSKKNLEKKNSSRKLGLPVMLLTCMISRCCDRPKIKTAEKKNYRKEEQATIHFFLFFV